jgi:AcrR family transcriptional regulator
MSTPPDRRTRKRLATRQAISDAATGLFLARGFDAVTVDEIAEAADVGRMTVFNHFPRKEDMFFDLDEAGRETVRAALRQRRADVGPIETLRLLAHRLVAEGSRYLRFFPGSQSFVQTVMGSEVLKARARAIRDEIADDLAVALSGSVRQGAVDRDARLAAALLVATWAEAFIEAHREYRGSRKEPAAKAVFLAIVDKGSLGVTAAMAGTPYC